MSHWIADVHGTHAVVETADELATWTRVRGWREASEPAPSDQVYITRAPDLHGRIPYEALLGGWADEGWKPGPPPEPVDPTRPPAPPVPVEPAAKPKTQAAAGGKNKES